MVSRSSPRWAPPPRSSPWPVAPVEDHGGGVVGEADEQRDPTDGAGFGERQELLVLEPHRPERQQEGAEREGGEVAGRALLHLLGQVQPREHRGGPEVEAAAPGVGEPQVGAHPGGDREQGDAVDREGQGEHDGRVGRRLVEGDEAQQERDPQRRRDDPGRGQRPGAEAEQQGDTGGDHHQRQDGAEGRVGLTGLGDVGDGVVAGPHDDAEHHHQHADAGQADAEAGLGPADGAVAEVGQRVGPHGPAADL